MNDFEKKLDYAKANTDLPDNPDYKEIREMMMSVNMNVVLKDSEKRKRK